MSSEWQSYQLGDLFELVNGFAFKGGDFKSSGIPVIKIKNVKPNSLLLGDLAFVDSEVADKRPDKELKRGDILITMSGNRMDGSRDTWVGKVAYFDVPGRYMLNQRVGVLRPKNGVEVDRKCCSYFLSSDDFQDFFIAVATSSGGQANLSPSQILGEKINLPPLAEQKQIASLLTALDDRITLLRETNATLEAIAQALFKSWFVDFDPVRAKQEGRAPEGMDEATAALFPDGFEESELGLVPKGWRVETIGLIADVIDCLHAKKPDLLESGKPFLQLNNIRDDGLLDISKQAFISEQDYQKWISRIEVAGGDCVITNVGRVGAVSQIPEGFRGAMGRNMTAIRMKPNHPYSTYLIELLLSPWMKAEIGTKTDVGTILDALNVKSIPKLRCTVAKADVMEAFESVTRPLRATMEMNLARSQTLATLRDTLLPRLISGQLRLPEAEAMVAAAV